MKTSPFLLFVGGELRKKFGEGFQILSIHPEFGGSINESFRLETNQGNYFLKRNDAERFPEMFEREAEGLQLLRANSTFKIPEVVAVSTFKEYAFLVMEYVPKESTGPQFWKNFGVALAGLHQQGFDQFGLAKDNYIGSLKQSNKFHEKWTDFFSAERIVPMVSLAHENGKLDLGTVKQFEQLNYKLDQFFPIESPSLLHGDLWSGNYIGSAGNGCCIFDPAVYYGHREMDIAMMHLFGGFHADTYKAYQEVFPLEAGWKERINLCNLYPLLVHANLFGGNYVKQVKQIVAQFS